MPLDRPVYLLSSQNGVLRQGEIISGLVQVVAALETIGSDEGEKAQKQEYDLAIVVSQDCDLQQDFDSRQNGTSLHRRLSDILFCQVEKADDVRFATNNAIADEEDKARSSLLKSRDVWKKIQENNDFRYQYLRAVEPGQDASREGLSPLIIDFSRTFSIPRNEVYRRLELRSATRRTVLNTPYLEHLAVRFHHFHCRVALPLDHHHELPKEDQDKAEGTL